MQIIFSSCSLPCSWTRPVMVKGNRQVSRNCSWGEQGLSVQFPTGALQLLFFRLPLFPRAANQQTRSPRLSSENSWSPSVSRQASMWRALSKGEVFQHCSFVLRSKLQIVGEWHVSGCLVESGSAQFTRADLTSPVPGCLHQVLEKRFPNVRGSLRWWVALSLMIWSSFLWAAGFLPWFQQAMSGHMKMFCCLSHPETRWWFLLLPSLQA